MRDSVILQHLSWAGCKLRISPAVAACAALQQWSSLILYWSLGSRVHVKIWLFSVRNCGCGVWIWIHSFDVSAIVVMLVQCPHYHTGLDVSNFFLLAHTMIRRLVWTTWTSMSAVPKKPFNLIIHSLAQTMFSIFQKIASSLVENFAKIHLPNWQFYLPQTVRQWDISSPETSFSIYRIRKQNQWWCLYWFLVLNMFLRRII